MLERERADALFNRVFFTLHFSHRGQGEHLFCFLFVFKINHNY